MEKGEGMESTTYKTTRVKLSMGEKVNYAVSEFGYNAIYIWISAFMTIFCTDYIGVPAAMVSVLLLLVRVFDAINDPMIGSLADRTRSKWGRYKPWVAIGGTVMSLLIIALFAAQPGWSTTFKIAYVWVVYILITVASTCCNMPYGALNGVLTSDTEERSKVSGVRMVFAQIGSNFTSLVAASLILFFSGTNGTENTAQGYLGAVVVTVVIGLPTILWSAVKSKERVLPPPEQMEKGNTIPMKTQLKCLFGNKYAIISMLGQFMCGFLSYGRFAIMSYYFTYVSGDFTLYSITGTVGIITGILGPGLLCPWLYRVFRHKGRAIGAGFGLTALTFIPMFLFDAHGIWFWVFYALSNLFMCAAGALRYSCDGDNVDFAEYKYGVRCDGFLSSFISLMLKAGGAVGPAVFLGLLGMFGYVPGGVQNATVLTLLNMGMSIIPAVLSGIAALAFLAFYDMDEKKHSTIITELEKRRGITAE
ncbi:MAG: glycoside-pentoside-hexuronide (GPH):cation symporter [Lachnospiraceae bacterium]|nr:glycoside-pentoside-hexuronide (GPH):cation symporter [Lachnospiraceae bacterium]